MYKAQNAHRALRLVVMTLALAVAAGVNAQALKTAIQTDIKVNKEAARAQKTVDRLADQADNLAIQYRTVLNETESLKIYNDQLERVVQDQRDQKASILRQMDQLEATNRGIIPLIIEMVEMLGELVQADVPFKLDERMARVATLEELLDKADITTSEKFRKVTEAYGIELDYGRSVETYEDNLPIENRKVKFLRIGRTLLLYQTLDEKQSGWWNPLTRKFEQLGKEYNDTIKQGIRMAAKQAAPDLVRLPTPGPKQAGGK